jgi:hypothetical protein
VLGLGDHADGLDTARHDPVDDDALRSEAGSLDTGTAGACDRDGSGRHGQTADQRRVTCDVVAAIALGDCAAEDHVVDLRAVDPRACDRMADGMAA